MKVYQEAEIWLHTVIAAALDGGEWSASGPSDFISGERASDTYCLRGWVGHKVGLEAVGKREIALHRGTQNMISGSPSRILVTVLSYPDLLLIT
jgi:hypothetical protein